MEDEEVKDSKEDTVKTRGTTCIRCGTPMDPMDPCDCNDLVFVYWEI